MATRASVEAARGRWAIIAVAALAGWVAPQAAQGNAITDVDQSLLSAIRTGAPSPPVASRDIAMVGIAMYDAVNAATGLTYQPYSYSGGAVPLASADAAAYYAGYSMLKGLFPAQSSSLQLQEDSAINNLGLSGITKAISQNLGTSIATNFFNGRATDGSATAQTPYTPGNQPGNYQFTNLAQTTVVQPGWGKVTPFAITSVDSVEPPSLWGPGSLYGATTEADFLASPQYLSALNTVKTTGCNGCGQTLDELNLSAFWADTNGNAQFGSTATPPGHWVAITDTVATNAGLSLLQTARVGAMVGASLADAGIVAWDVKNDNDFWRPDTAIHATGVGGGNDPTWRPLWPDPLFQSYISGHSTFSMAAADARGFLRHRQRLILQHGRPECARCDQSGVRGNTVLHKLHRGCRRGGRQPHYRRYSLSFRQLRGAGHRRGDCGSNRGKRFRRCARAVFNGSTGDRGDGPRADIYVGAASMVRSRFIMV
jgi:hypothetical protein